MTNPQVTKQDFPLFSHHPDLVYLDSAATSLKPMSVIEAEKDYLEKFSANIARGLYPLAEAATEKFEATREKVAQFIGAHTDEIIFTSGTTDSLNLAAKLLAHRVKKTSNIIITEMEHHSNFLPWKELAKRENAALRIIPLSEEGKLDPVVFAENVDEHTVLITFSAASNVLGTINPVQEITQRIRETYPHVIIVIDAAQAVGHIPVEVTKWDADFIAFSAHKCFGPTGVGVLFGKREVLETLAPVNFGGGMVVDACSKPPLYREVPHCFEPGTPNIGGVIGFGAALDFLRSIDIGAAREHEVFLTTYAMKKLEEAFGNNIRIVGPRNANGRGGIIAFALDGAHPHDIAHLLGEKGICVRAGEHCAAPLHRALDLNATTRISFSIYNTKEDIDRLIESLKIAQRVLTV